MKKKVKNERGKDRRGKRGKRGVEGQSENAPVGPRFRLETPRPPIVALSLSFASLSSSHVSSLGIRIGPDSTSAWYLGYNCALLAAHICGRLPRARRPVGDMVYGKCQLAIGVRGIVSVLIADDCAFLQIPLFVTPFHRMFSLDNKAIQYPYAQHERVPVGMSPATHSRLRICRITFTLA